MPLLDDILRGRENVDFALDPSSSELSCVEPAGLL